MLVKDLIEISQDLVRSVIILIGSENELNADLARLRKKGLNTLSNFELKSFSSAFSKKSVFQYSQGLAQMI